MIANEAARQIIHAPTATNLVTLENEEARVRRHDAREIAVGDAKHEDGREDDASGEYGQQDQHFGLWTGDQPTGSPTDYAEAQGEDKQCRMGDVTLPRGI